MKTFYKFFLMVATISLCSCINEDVNLQTEAIGESYEAHIEMKDFKTSLINAAKNKSSDSNSENELIAQQDVLSDALKLLRAVGFQADELSAMKDSEIISKALEIMAEKTKIQPIK